MPRFTILAHDHPTAHWDLFLEAGPVLRSWRLLAPLQPGIPVPAERIGDHRLLYLDYEGPVSDGRGNVTRIDAGSFEWLSDSTGELLVILSGARYVGRLRLRQGGEGSTALFEVV